MPYFTYEEQIEVNRFLNENCNGDLRKDIVLNEDTQIATTAGTLNKILDLTISRYKKIDFTDIERSRGDAKECKFYKNLNESIDILCKLDDTTHKLPGAKIVRNTLDNLIALKEDFTRAFRMKNDMGILIYNTMYYTLMEGTSYLIAASVDYSVEGKQVRPRIYEVNCRDVVILNNLSKFNSLVGDKTVAKFIKSTEPKTLEDSTASLNEVTFGDALKKFFDFASDVKADNNAALKKTLAGAGVVVTVAAILYLAIKIVPIIKICIYILHIHI